MTNAQNFNSTHRSCPNALESLNILEQAKDDKGCVPMSLVRQAFRNVMEQEQSCDTCKHKSEGFNSRRCGDCSVGYPDRYEAETNFEATSKNFELYTEEES